jgi:hypothetical protein
VGLFGRGTSGRMEGERSKELVNMMEAFYIWIYKSKKVKSMKLL